MQALDIGTYEGIQQWLLFYRLLPGSSVIVEEDMLMTIYNY